MWKWTSNWFFKISSGRVALAALVIFLLFTALVLPDQAAKLETATGIRESPDTSFIYSANDLYQMADAYGAEGRAAYIRARFSFDLVFPLVFTFFLVTAISWVYAHVFPTESAWRHANLVPLSGMVFDYLENLSASLVMLRYPQRTAVVDWLAPVFTLIKWVFISVSVLLLVAGFLQWMRAKKEVDL
ncbi:MAG TPA: hypothetical protein G4N92_05310 [Anaerolineae bacterium]|nr:hypothetical protein [Anaerolineae bacterium]